MRVLILTPYRNEHFTRCQASRVLVTALERRRMSFRLHRPWRPLEDLERYDAVLTWSYGHPYGDYFAAAVQLELRCAQHGIPVVNPARHSCWSRHSDDLHRWRLHGLRCARYQKLCFGVHEIALPFPLLLRRDGTHRGRNMRLVHDMDEAREAWEEGLALHEPNPLDPEDPRPFDMAVEYIDTRWSDGFYRKYRTYVVGDRVIACHLMHRREWLVNFVSLVSTEQTRAEHKRFMVEGEPRPELLRRAARAVDGEIVGIDYSVHEDGRVVLWEANRRVNMAGDRGDEGYATVEPRRCDFEYGEAVVELLLARGRARAHARKQREAV